MQVETLEPREFLSADPHPVSVPFHVAAGGNLPGNSIVGHATHLGRFTAAFNEQGVLVITAANGDELRAVAGPLVPVSDTVFHIEGNYLGGTGRFAGAAGAFSHDITFTDAQGNFVYEVDTTVTLQRPRIDKP